MSEFSNSNFSVILKAKGDPKTAIFHCFYFKNFLPFSSTMFLPLPIMGLKEAAMAVKWVRSCIAILFTTWYPEPHTPLFCKREAKTLLL